MASRRYRSVLPGVALLLALAALARIVGDAVGANVLVLAVVFGAVVGASVGTPAWAEPGVRLHKPALEAAIVLLGAAVALDELVAAGLRVLLLVIATVAVGAATVELVSRRVFRLEKRIGSLLAAGACICGVSAAAAVSQVIDARADQLALAVATVLLFDALTLVTFPLFGAWVGLTPREFGVWAGLSMFSTGPVTAAGFAHSPEAGQWATVTKLARNALLGVVVVAYSTAYATRSPGAGTVRQLWTRFPKFLVGFFVVAAVANFGPATPEALAVAGTTADWLFAVAFVGLGFEIRPAQMREAGAGPALVAATYLLVVGASALFAVRLFL